MTPFTILTFYLTTLTVAIPLKKDTDSTSVSNGNDLSNNLKTGPKKTKLEPVEEDLYYLPYPIKKREDTTTDDSMVNYEEVEKLAKKDESRGFSSYFERKQKYGADGLIWDIN